MPASLFSDQQLRDRDIDTLKRHLRYKLGGYQIVLRDIRAGNLFYRGVLWQQRPSKTDQVSYPPPERVTQYGRANRAGAPMFYCSAGGPAVFYELGAKAGDCIALSEWELTEPLWAHNLGYHPHALRRLGAQNTEVREWLTNPIPNESRQNASLRAQLSLAFTEDVQPDRLYRYKQSIAINEMLFDRTSPLQVLPGGPRSTLAAGTIYPAVRMRGDADNMAIMPAFTDTSLHLKSIRYVLVEAADQQQPSYSFLTLALSRRFSENDIIWQNNLPPEDRRRSRTALENGHWVLRDGFGDVYHSR